MLPNPNHLLAELIVENERLKAELAAALAACEVKYATRT